MPSGLIILDKPAGMTSASAVNRVKRMLPRGTKIGHAGTLDSFATGILILLIGNATRHCETLMDQPKQYHATIKLGATTATDDPESSERPTGAEAVERSRIEMLVPRFVGTIEQVPPVYSALKLGGVRASDRARSGEQIAMKPRAVTIYGIEVLRYEWPQLELRIDCGRGTYIRSIAREMGQALQTGGYLSKLRRTKIGEYDEATAIRLDRLDEQGIESRIIAPQVKILHPLTPPL